MSTSPTTLSIAECKRRKWIYCKSEYWQVGHQQMALLSAARAGIVGKKQIAAARTGAGGVRKDLFGFIDIVAMDLESQQMVAIQATSYKHDARQAKKHMRKIVQDCWKAAAGWIVCGGRIEIWVWQRTKEKVNRRNWHLNVVPVLEKDLMPAKMPF